MGERESVMTKINLAALRSAANDHIYKTYMVPFVAEFSMYFESPEIINIGNHMCDWVNMLSPAELANIAEVTQRSMPLMILGYLQTATTR